VSRFVAFAVTLVLAMVAAGCTSAARWRVGSTSGGPAWHDCGDEARENNPALPAALRIDCATITVPRDWAGAAEGRPADGRTFDIALMRVRSAQQVDRIGSILVNPGGPGGYRTRRGCR
jgi:hypothetical protein